VLLAELGQVLRRIGTDADDDGIGGSNPGGFITESLGVRSSARGPGLGIEVEDDFPAAKVRELDRFSFFVE